MNLLGNKKTVFEIGEYFVAAPFEKIKKVLEDGLEESKRIETEDDLADLKLEIEKLQNQLEEKTNQFKKFQKEKKK